MLHFLPEGIIVCITFKWKCTDYFTDSYTVIQLMKIYSQLKSTVNPSHNAPQKNLYL